MAQWGAYGQARRGVKYKKILAHYYPGTKLVETTTTSVRVLLAEGRRNVTVHSESPLRLLAGDGEMYDLLKSMGASRMQIFRLLKLPGALPSLFSGMKISAAYSIMGAVIGEWLGAKAGLGEFMRRSMHSFAVDKTFAAIIVITVLSLGVFEIIKLLEGWLMPWAKYAARQEE